MRDAHPTSEHDKLAGARGAEALRASRAGRVSDLILSGYCVRRFLEAFQSAAGRASQRATLDSSGAVMAPVVIVAIVIALVSGLAGAAHAAGLKHVPAWQRQVGE